jgi:hypothetical protein
MRLRGLDPIERARRGMMVPLATGPIEDSADA